MVVDWYQQFFCIQWNMFIFNHKYLKNKKMYLYPVKFFCIQYKTSASDGKSFDI